MNFATTGTHWNAAELSGSSGEMRAPWWFLGLAILLIAVAFIMPLDVAWKHSTFDDYVDPDATEVNASAGNWTRQVTMGSLGVFGLLSLLLPGGRKLRCESLTALLCLGYLGWCLLTCLWAEDASFAFKRWGVLICEVLMGLGLAKRAAPRQFVWVIWFCTLAWMGLGIVAEVSQSTFRPWAAGYRFAGVFHPNEMGGVCAALTMASLYLARSSGVRNRLILAVAGVSFALLVLSGSRGSLGALVVAYAAMWLLMTPGPVFVIRSFAAVIVASLTLLLAGLGVFRFTEDSVTMGRQDNEVGSLTGRVPLWEELLGFVGDRPLEGYGFNAFWSGDRIADISYSQGWTLSTAHNTYIDLLLNVGLIGAVLCLAAMAGVMYNAARLEARLPGSGYGFVAMLVIFALANGFLETTVGITWFLSVFGICGACYIAAYAEPESARVPAPEDAPLAWPTFSRRGGLVR